MLSMPMIKASRSANVATPIATATKSMLSLSCAAHHGGVTIH
jgi:hypothetical protein